MNGLEAQLFVPGQRLVDRILPFVCVFRQLDKAFRPPVAVALVVGQHMAAHIHPANGQQLGILGHQGLGPAGELRGHHLAVGNVARQPHQLLLALQQAQAQALLGVFDVALERFLLAAHLLQTQIAEGREDDHHEQQHRQQGRHMQPAVGAQQRPALAPAADGVGQGADGCGATERLHPESVGHGPVDAVQTGRLRVLNGWFSYFLI